MTRKKPLKSQSLARRKTLAYVNRLGLRKAARRLDTDVATLRKWLAPAGKGFPVDRLVAAEGLGRPGGAYVLVKGSSLAKLIKSKGLRAASILTGIPGANLKKLRKQNPKARVQFNRDRLKKVVAKTGQERLAALLGVPQKRIQAARQLPLTQVTRRLGRLAKHYGRGKVASAFGLTEKQLTGWLKKGIPQKWETIIDQSIGKRLEGQDEKRFSKPRSVGQVAKDIKAAVKSAKAWNRKAPRRFQIALAEAERWAHLGLFPKKLEAAQAALRASKALVRRGKPKPPPRKAPLPPVLPPGTAPPPVKKKPPKKPAAPPAPPTPPKIPPIAEIAEERKRNFLQARSEAFFEGRYRKPPIPFGTLKEWSLIHRRGVHIFKQIEKFVHEIDLDALGTEIIEQARKVWQHFAENTSGIMTVILTFSVLGTGNPFYREAFVAGDEVNFLNRQEDIFSEEQIERQVRLIMEDTYDTDTNVTMLFLEHYEIIKSIRKDKPPETK